MDNYEKLETLGEGTYGVVFKAKDRNNKQVVAVKQIKIDSDDEGMPSTAMRQISILNQLKSHPNIVILKQVLYQVNLKSLHLVFQFVEHDLKKYMISKKNTMTTMEVKSLMFQLINGVGFCHSRRVIHRDLKPQNILINSEGTLKLADFGLSRAVNLPIKTLTHQIQTLWYRAPEILLGQRQYSLGVDIWAIGCIFVELVQKKPLFNGENEIDQIFKIFQFHGTPTLKDWSNINKLPDMKPTFPKFKPKDPAQYFKKFDKTGLDLLMRLIVLDPAKRISMKECLCHSYFDDLDISIKKKYSR